VKKTYQVILANPLTSEYVSAFAQGMYFGYEKAMTLPAVLEIIASRKAKVILTEGRYHQIKRMFGRFRNPVLALNRESIGQLCLDGSLKLGESRLLTALEVKHISN
jgi:16S rRNA pseudouridine516 synthase